MSLDDGYCWCIKSPTGLIMERTIAYTRTECINEWLEHWEINWRLLKRKGYSCVKVQVIEEK